MNHRAGTHGSIDILPGQYGWNKYLKAFKPGEERDAVRKAGYEKLAAKEKLKAESAEPRPPGLSGGPQ